MIAEPHGSRGSEKHRLAISMTAADSPLAVERGMTRTLLSILFLLGSVVPWASAQQTSLVGTWESYQFDGDMGFTYNWVLRLHDDGSCERFALSNNPDQPLARDAGEYALHGSQLDLVLITDFMLGPTRYSCSARQDTLYWQREPVVPLTRGYEIEPTAMMGTWQLYGPEGNPTGSRIILGVDGNYQADFGTEWAKGPYFIVGSGLVLWTVETNMPGLLLGEPGVWTSLQVEGDRMSYTIGKGVRISAIRVAPTAVATATWGKVKAGR
jgi:hypothetical protein